MKITGARDPEPAATPSPDEATAGSRKPGWRYTRRAVTWPLLLACSFLIFVSASSIYLVVSSQSAGDRMNQALLVENKLWSMLGAVRVAESEQRGYLLTGDPRYLDVYHTTVDASAAAIAGVKGAIIGVPSMQQAFAGIEPAVTRKIDELHETIRLHDAGHRGAALALVGTGVGLDLMTKIRVPTLHMMQEQRRIVSLQTSNSASTNTWLLAVNLAGLALIVVLAVIAILVMRRMAAKEVAQSESRADDLQAAVTGLRKAERKFKDLLEAAPDAMVVLNRDEKIVLLNLETERQFGYRRDELLGQTMKTIIPGGFPERLSADGLRSSEEPLARQVGVASELRGRRKDGSEFPIEITLGPLEGPEGVLVTAAIRNISARKDAEERLLAAAVEIGQHERVNRLKDEFVATVSHELRTPLTSITASLGLLVASTVDTLPKPAQKLMTIAFRNSQRLTRLINDILDIQKMEAGEVVFAIAPVNVGPVVEQAIEANRAIAESQGVQVRFDKRLEADMVPADPDRLVQVVTNLLSNAIKFSSAGQEVLVAIEDAAGHVRISVMDHGAGIPEAFKPRIFQKFAQADGSDSRLRGGTGLGLSIAREIIVRHGGKVDFTDAPGGGTVFRVDLPRGADPARAASGLDRQRDIAVRSADEAA